MCASYVYLQAQAQLLGECGEPGGAVFPPCYQVAPQSRSWSGVEERAYYAGARVIRAARRSSPPAVRLELARDAPPATTPWGGGWALPAMGLRFSATLRLVAGTVAVGLKHSAQGAEGADMDTDGTLSEQVSADVAPLRLAVPKPWRLAHAKPEMDRQERVIFTAYLAMIALTVTFLATVGLVNWLGG
jgi:hypothetical protein